MPSALPLARPILRGLQRPAVACAVSLLMAAAMLVMPAPGAYAADRDCGDFDSQAQAQRFHDENGPGDPHRLDSDGDGRACESNPCPCAAPGASGGEDGGTPDRRPARVRQAAAVTGVVDGDTVDVRLRGGREVRVRLIGIDTPEVYGGTECGGPQASRSLRRLLPRGARVTLVNDRTQDQVDRYGRMLRYLVTRDERGMDVNRAQVARGWAEVYVYGGVEFERTRGYRGSERRARSSGRGIWGRC